MIARSSALALTFAAALTVAGCNKPAEKAEVPAAPTIAPSADVHPFMIGSLQAVALKDGDITMQIKAGEIPWSDPDLVATTLAAAGRLDYIMNLSIQPLLLRDGDRVVLIDSGAGGQMGTQNKLLASLKAAGVAPEDVTDVLISHAHGDHVGGLAAGGKLNFPNATIRMSAPEWEFLKAGAPQVGAEALVTAITPKVQTFEPGAQITPSIKAVPLAGHTPGHSGYEITSGAESLLYFGDAMHSSVISVVKPDWTNGWDEDVAAGVVTRQSLMTRGGRLYGVHFPFPGVGRIEKQGEGYVWVPEG